MIWMPILSRKILYKLLKAILFDTFSEARSKQNHLPEIEVPDVQVP